MFKNSATVAAILLSIPSFAIAESIGSLYFSGSFGQTTSSFAGDSFGDDFDVEYDLERKSTGYGLAFGYRYNRMLGFEIGYFDLGEWKEEYKYVFDNELETTKAPSTSLRIGVRARYPQEGSLYGTASFGIHRWETTLKSRTSYGDDEVYEDRYSFNGTDMYVGGGIGYNLSNSLGFSLQFIRNMMSEASIELDVDQILFTVTYNFGRPISSVSRPARPEPLHSEQAQVAEDSNQEMPAKERRQERVRTKPQHSEEKTDAACNDRNRHLFPLLCD